MPAASVDRPAVSLSFANNFWGKEDAGVQPLLERMLAAKQTSDELKAFYSVRASIEEDYARKLLSLCRKPLGSLETGSLRTSLDTLRGEVEAMAKQHQNNAAQMKSELEEPLGAFAGGMKERRKIVQNGIEKLLKTKIQQTQHVNKTRDRYEQECLKIKGYLAQGHMVMGQEERKNKAKLEKTQISVATSNTEYEHAVKALEDTTARWNREWKAAADKFQDLEEERLDFTKSSLWQFANIASTVCVSDDASCEKIRLSLEKMDVEKDIITFINDRGTGQEIPDPPKYINFCRGDATDTQSEAPEPIDANASLALNVGQNVFSVTTPDMEKRMANNPKATPEENDPIALALAELKGVGADKQATVRVSADRYHGIATPAPSSQQSFARSVPPLASSSAATTGLRGTPPPSYDQQVQRLGVPPAAVTARAMKETSQKFTEQARSVFGSDSRPGSSGFTGNSTARTTTRGREVPRAMSPAPPRSVSPRPDMSSSVRSAHRTASPNPGLASQHDLGAGPARPQDQDYYRQGSPNGVARSASPAPFREYTRSNSGPAQVDIEVGMEAGQGQALAIVLWDFTMVEDPRKAYTRDGRAILHFARAMYMYQAAIPEELGFSKGDMMAVLRHQDDGWWEAEVHGGNGRVGLVPSNYLQAC
ncbi:Septation protein imp2 like [Verticillium longisporum]|nr:Septation protein imp2 like [Verticillium longisporum]